MIRTNARINTAERPKDRPEVSSGTVEVFIEQMDSLYWQGYARELATSKPEEYTAQLWQFMNEHKLEA